MLRCSTCHELLRKAPLGIGAFPRDIVRMGQGTAPLAPTRMLDGQMINGHETETFVPSDTGPTQDDRSHGQ